jgi:hypothetical protein
MDITDLSMEITHPYKNHETNSVTTFINIDKLYELATTQAHIGSSIPQGVEQSVFFFVIDDTDNRKRRQLNKYSEYPDDCGACQQGKNSTKTNVYISTKRYK